MFFSENLNTSIFLSQNVIYEHIYIFCLDCYQGWILLVYLCVFCYVHFVKFMFNCDYNKINKEF